MNRIERAGLEAYRAFYGEQALEVGAAVVFHIPQAPDSPMLNRVVGLGVDEPATEAALDEALALLEGTRHYVAVTPGAEPPQLVDWLAKRGFEPGWGWTQFCRGVDELPALETELELVEVGSDQTADFARVVATGYRLPDATLPLLGLAPVRPGWTCWLALADGEPAGAAALHVGDGAAYLGFAATLPEHRGKGAQNALLAARIRRAAEMGCDLVVTETGERREGLSIDSYRNILRAGFVEQYVVANWVRSSTGQNG